MQVSFTDVMVWLKAIASGKRSSNLVGNTVYPTLRIDGFLFYQEKINDRMDLVMYERRGQK